MESLLERKNLEKAMLERQLSAKPAPELASYIEGYMLARTKPSHDSGLDSLRR